MDESNVSQGEVQTIRASNWMEDISAINPDFAQRKLNTIVIPGTHDSATYAVSHSSDVSPDILSQYSYPSLVKPIFSTDVLRRVFTRFAKSQSLSIRQQLHHGIRYLDIRLCYKAEPPQPLLKRLWICHGLFSDYFEQVVNDVKEFIRENPKEIVLFDVNHMYGLFDEIHTAINTFLYCAFGDSLLFKSCEDSSIESVGSLSLEDLWRLGKSVIVFYPEVKTNLPFNFFFDCDNDIRSEWPNKQDIDELIKFLNEEHKRKPNDGKFHVLQAVLTPNMRVIARSIASMTDKNSLFDIAESVRHKFHSALLNPKHWDSVNIIIQDFFHEGEFIMCCMARNAGMPVLVV